MSKLNNILARAAAALKGDESPEKLTETLREANERLEAVEARQRAIGTDGGERRRVLDSGTPAELVALDAELAELRAEEQQLRHRAAEIHRIRETRTAEHAVRDASKNRRALSDAVKRAQDARRNFDAALAEAQAAADTLHQGLVACRRVQFEAGEAAIFAEASDVRALVAMQHPDDLNKQADAAQGLNTDASRAIRRDINEQRMGRLPEKGGAMPLY